MSIFQWSTSGNPFDQDFSRVYPIKQYHKSGAEGPLTNTLNFFSLKIASIAQMYLARGSKEDTTFDIVSRLNMQDFISTPISQKEVTRISALSLHVNVSYLSMSGSRRFRVNEN